MSIICREELKRLRLNMLNSLYQCKTGHLGGSFSCLEFLALVYTKFPHNLQLVMSKGHASLALYTVIDWVRNSDNPIMKHYGKESDGEFHGHISKKPMHLSPCHVARLDMGSHLVRASCCKYV